MTESLKPWQRGHDIDYLKSLEAQFADYNSYSLSPFSEMNKPAIAEALHDKTLKVFDWGVVDTGLAVMSTTIKAYLDVPLARKQAGDREVVAFTYGDPLKMTRYLDRFTEPTWVWIWQECAEQRRIVHDAGYEFVGSKISSHAEIRGLYFRDGEDSTDLFPRETPRIDPVELIGIHRTPISVNVADAVREVEALTLDYTKHYSNYNVGKSWSALSLRGYTADPSFIIKPAEMNKKWHVEHAHDHFELQDTPLRSQLSAINALCEPLTRVTNVHRIRLMRLSPGGGELRRHTDLVDKDSGISDGHVARFHFPLVTNPGVAFSSWDMLGERHEVNMRVGECWYLDTRKPHAAINAGCSDRTHLVVDVESNCAVRALLLN